MCVLCPYTVHSMVQFMLVWYAINTFDEHVVFRGTI